MATPPLDRDKVLPTVLAFNRLGDRDTVADELGVSRHTVRRHLRFAEENGITGSDEDLSPGPIIRGQIEHDEGQPVMSRKTRGVDRYLCTVAQNNTHLHAELWQNLTAFAEFYGADILVARCTYGIKGYRNDARKKLAGMDHRPQDDGLWFPNEIEPHIVQVGERVRLAGDLVFVASDVSPTKADPLAGMDTLTGPASSIFPHNQIAMRSVATMKADKPKFLFSTGTVSQRNYLPGDAGKKAAFHHSYGALLVEVDRETGNWWCRQINASDTGSFYDLDLFVEHGKVAEGHRPECVVWGDIHVAKLEDEIRDAVWAPGGIVDELRPRIQVFHDVLDFHARNYHEIKDPFLMFKRHVESCESVDEELRECADFLKGAHRDDCISLVVNSNHDRHFERWLKEQDWRRDPINARVFLEAAAAQIEAIAANDNSFLLLEWALQKHGCPDAIRFLREDEPFRICEHAGGGIELGLHGDRGANGARGTPTGFKKAPFKINFADKHAPGIYQGAYGAGAMCSMDMGYNRGMSSWARAFIVTHPNGKRQIITMNGTEYRAA